MLEIITPPQVADDFRQIVRDHLKIDVREPGDTYSDPDEAAILDLVDAYTDAALEKIESASGRMLFKQTLCMTLDAFAPAILLPASPTIAVSRIEYLDVRGDEQTLTDEAFIVLDRMEYPRLVPSRSNAWPETWDFPGSIKITFDAGYAGADNDMDRIPAQLRMATMQTVADFFRFGGTVATVSLAALPADARRACRNFRRIWF